MPEPIIEPMTIIVASSRPSSRTSFGRRIGRGWVHQGLASCRAGRAHARLPIVRQSLALGERLDVGDGLLDRLAAPGGQGAVEGAGQLVGQVPGGVLGGLALGADLGEVAVIDLRGVGRRAGRHDHSAQVRLHERVLIAGGREIGRRGHPGGHPRPSPFARPALKIDPGTACHSDRAGGCRRSPCRRMQSRSIPRPKAKPVTSSGSYPTARKTFGIDHARPPHFNPAVAAVPEHVDLDARLGEREERGAEPDLDVAPR